MRRNLASEDRDDVEINLSPMIDMVFILLIFFIVTTVFVEETGVEVAADLVESGHRARAVGVRVFIENDRGFFFAGLAPETGFRDPLVHSEVGLVEP